MPVATSYYRDIWSCSVEDELSGWELSMAFFVYFPSDAEHGQCLAAINHCCRLNIEVLPLRAWVGWWIFGPSSPKLDSCVVMKQTFSWSFHVPLWPVFRFQWKALSNHGAKRYSRLRVDDVMAFLFLHSDLREPPSTFPYMLGFDTYACLPNKIFPDRKSVV